MRIRSNVITNVTLLFIIEYTLIISGGRDMLTRYSDSLRAGRSGERIPVEARFSAPVQTGPGAYPAFYTMGTGSLSRG